MPPFFSNKKLIILLASLIFLVALVGFSLKEREKLSWPEQFVHDTVGFFQVVFNRPAQYVAGFFENVNDIRNVYEENKTLKKHLRDYAQLHANYDNLQEQYTSLKKQLHIDSVADIDAYNRHVAMVSARSFDGWNQQITVNKGKQQGIQNGWPVVTAEGFIGKVTAVSQFSSTVTLITDPKSNNQIAAEVQNKDQVNGMIEGYDADKNVLLFKKIDIKAKIKKGDEVVTSGMGNVYPKGLLIGKVKSVGTDNYGLTKVAEIEPAAAVNRLDFVNILERKTADSGTDSKGENGQ
ncbi:rod shape-determining protein MreC [Pullulanibacillus pueri]|uniref:Cell shape-determining protein MreC n=1 Tax=Pullulanibacillus pueri TaxID=1437324 RepID=A0A8J2ZYV7_9BACL|nr:rod shape-determining protein MreC [Pullulanibacillus pueri]MBM7683291.1 rod shape-determining protein MreC [Pullulanibacillus pueri]GGH85850.1 cell shape-determining protein MreC [Pullulanibacillus pueri]